MSIGTRIRDARLGKGWSQDDLAHGVREVTGGKIKVAANELSRHERGIHHPRLELVVAIAQATEKPMEFFTATEEAVVSEDDEEAALRRAAARAASQGDYAMLEDLMPSLRRYERQKVEAVA